MEPLFSIITVTYNAADTVGRTIESVNSQSCTDYEHLIIDGASNDATLSIIESLPNQLRRSISEHDSGLYDAMNKGVALAKGKYLIFLNAGDKFHSPSTLSIIANAIKAEDYPGIVYGQTLIVDSEGANPRPRHLIAPESLSLKSFANGMVVCHQAFVVLRKFAPGYNLRYRFSADYEWCIKCLQHSRKNVYIASEPLIDYLDEGLTTKNRRRSLIERFRIMCFYYGTIPTILRHVKFFFRNLKRR